MNNKLTDERLDKMLDEYFSREPEVEFSARLAREERRPVNVTHLKRSLAIAAAVFWSFTVVIVGIDRYRYYHEGMFGAVVVESGDDDGSQQGSSDELFVTSTAPDSQPDESETLASKNPLFLLAYGDKMTEADMQKMKDEAVVGARDLNNLRQERLDYGKIWYAEDMAYRYSVDDESKPIDFVPAETCTEEKDIINETLGCIYLTNIRLCVNGENISRLSFESEKDAKIVCAVPGGDFATNVDTGEKQPSDSYLDPTDVEYQEYLRITYIGLKELIYDGENIINDEPFPSREEVKHLTEKRREFFKDMDAAKYNKYFGDTVTVTATYTDGSQSISHIYITFDDEGNYLIDYD